MADPAATAKAGLATIAAATLAIVCCVAGPLVVAVAGSLAVGAWLGAVGTFTVIAACAALYVRHRARTARGRRQ